MLTNGHIPLSRFLVLERVSATQPGLNDLGAEIQRALSSLSLPPECLRGHRIAVSCGSRGIAALQTIIRAICGWLKEQGASPFVFPGMGSHGGATAEGQLKVLEGYGITPDQVGTEIRSSMESVSLGSTPEGFQAYMDRNAWEADGVLVMNRVKPHTDFSGSIESGLLKMMAVGMGKVEGARQVHRWGWKYGFERSIRSISGRVLGTGKILCGLAVIENELHQICAVRAARPEGIVAQEEAALKMARPLVLRIPFPRLHLLIVDELGKNISGTGMDTKVIGRGVELQPGEAPEIRQIYVRSLAPESAGNACGTGFADVISERLYRQIDFQKTFINALTSLNPQGARVPIYLASDRAAIDLTLGHLGMPAPEEQRVIWIKNTLCLERMAISEALTPEAQSLQGWRLKPGTYPPQFDDDGNLKPLP